MTVNLRKTNYILLLFIFCNIINDYKLLSVSTILVSKNNGKNSSISKDNSSVTRLG